MAPTEFRPVLKPIGSDNRDIGTAWLEDGPKRTPVVRQWRTKSVDVFGRRWTSVDGLVRRDPGYSPPSARPIRSTEAHSVLGENFPQILAASRSGAEWAWTSMYRDLAPAVLGYLRARGAHEPEDLTGEVFLQIVRDLSGFAGDEREFRAWAFTIAHHRLIDDRRRQARRPPGPAPEPENGSGPSGDVEEEALQAIAAERVRRIIERLSPEQRDVLLLRVMGGLTVEQVAKAVGKSPGAVKALQRRGLAAIERDLSNEGVTL